MSEEGLPYALYGLADANPYADYELDPLQRPADRERWLDLDGFVDKRRILRRLRQAVEQKKPAFVLIGGRDYTGRTSTANCVMDKYAELRGVGQRFLRVPVVVEDQGELGWLRYAIGELWGDARRTVSGLREDLKECGDKIVETSDSKAYTEFRFFLQDLSVDLAKLDKPYAFGLLFEQVRSAKFAAAAMKTFARSQAVVVFTYDGYQHSQTADSQGFQTKQFQDVEKIDLQPLLGDQVRMLAQERWKEASRLECPFDADGLEQLYQLYHKKGIPIKPVLKRLANLLDHRLKWAPHDIAWPENRDLFMDLEWLKQRFDLLESLS